MEIHSSTEEENNPGGRYCAYTNWELKQAYNIIDLKNQQFNKILLLPNFSWIIYLLDSMIRLLRMDINMPT